MFLHSEWNRVHLDAVLELGRIIKRNSLYNAASRPLMSLFLAKINYTVATCS